MVYCGCALLLRQKQPDPSTEKIDGNSFICRAGEVRIHGFWWMFFYVLCMNKITIRMKM